MSIEENKTLVRRYCEEVLDPANVDLIDEFLAPDFVDHHGDPSIPSSGPEYFDLFKREYSKNRAALSDARYVIEDMIAEGDKVVVRGTFTAVHDRGEWVGMAPSGERVTLTSIYIYRVEGGKIVEMWVEDSMGRGEENPSST